MFISLVVSTTEPGRKPTDVENGDESINGDILSAISVGIETTKNILKGDVENTNGNSKNNGTVNDVPIDEVASSSGVTKSDNAEVSVAVTVTVAEPSKDQPKVESSEKDLAEEKPVNDKPTVDDKPKVDAEPTVDDKKDDIPVAKEEQSIDEPSEVSTTDKTDKAVIEETAPEQIKEENAKVEESSEAIMKEIPSDANIVEQSIDVKIDKVEPISPVKEPIVSDKPPTPKRACSDDEDDPIENGDRSAKKIKLDTSESIECEKAVEPQPEVPKVESTEESEALKVDEAKKEDELLEDVVDSVLAVEQSKVDSSTDTPAISDESVIEKEPIDKPIENPIEPVVEDKPQAPIESITPVSSELIVDFTPDEALNELVSSDLANDVVPTEPIAEEKSLETADNNITEPIVTTPATPVDMNVEENETAVPAVVVASETPDTAMEAAPIKADEEMDVDESNSTDAMDL